MDSPRGGWARRWGGGGGGLMQQMSHGSQTKDTADPRDSGLAASAQPDVIALVNSQLVSPDWLTGTSQSASLQICQER